MRRFALLLLSVAACSNVVTAERNLIMAKPDYVTSTGIRVYYNGLDAGVSNNAVDYTVTHVLSDCLNLCPNATNDVANKYVMSWMPDNFECLTRKVHGCDYNYTIYVSSLAVIPDEIGHICFYNCNETSEIELADGGAEYTPAFQSFLNKVNQ